ncbi:folylpolyglutamate synthase, mitochondrial [Cebus imitator]|uniref:folylpolyglutamate synthase, mitochondrial n=1 Tax=Cebus imitator TaxID=2715852 RepID=UPI001899610F|nr:folylpolyglutamate synthase, mitochondrial [Cebus imitator]
MSPAARSHLGAALFLAAASARSVTTQVAARRGLSAWPVLQEPSMEYQDAVRMLNTLQTNASYLEQAKRQRGDPQTQLEAMELYLARSGLQVEDLDRLNIIHVTGTKGKGSTCAFTECILRSYGLKTGFFSSPHLVQVRERIRINGQPISRDLFTKYFWRLYQRLEETKDGSCVSMPPYFRFLTLMAFHVFLQEKVDLAVVEVGIGGAYDCTNIIRKPVVCGVSSLGIDHTSLLGDTVEKIAWQKGGIFKQGVPAFTVLQPEGPLAVLRDRAQQISCPLYLCPPLEALEEGGLPLTLGLEGEHQRSNAALALQLAHCWLQWQNHHDAGELKASRPGLLWQLPLAPVFQPTSHMRLGLRNTEWLGRTQVLRRGPLTWYLDGAHTPSSVQACVRWFRRALQSRERQSSGTEVRVLLFNTTGDRDSAVLLKLLQVRSRLGVGRQAVLKSWVWRCDPGGCQLLSFQLYWGLDVTRCMCCFRQALQGHGESSHRPLLILPCVQTQTDQQNFTVTLDQVLLRCLEHQQHWNYLDEEQASPALWSAPSPELAGPASLLLAPHPPHSSASSLVFSCISHALQWISQGRDPVFQPPSSPKSLLTHPAARSGASILHEAAAVHVLVTGSLHLVGGVLKLLEPALSQ